MPNRQFIALNNSHIGIELARLKSESDEDATESTNPFIAMLPSDARIMHVMKSLYDAGYSADITSAGGCFIKRLKAAAFTTCGENAAEMARFANLKDRTCRQAMKDKRSPKGEAAVSQRRKKTLDPE